MTVAIFGLGLIGGSIGRNLVKNSDYKVLGYDIDNATMLKAQAMGAIHEEINEENIKSADIVILAVTPNAAIKIMREICGKLKSGCVVADCCGNKRIIVQEMNRLKKLYDLEFVGMHPMAGREFSGLSHSTISLFENAYFILVPVHNSIEGLVKIKEMISYLGEIKIVISTADKHDKIISYTSQLAHIVSSAYIKNPISINHVGYSAGSFKDMTRVAKLNPQMWTELFLENKDNLIEQIDFFQKAIDEYRQALEKEDGEKLEELLKEGADMKEAAENARKIGVIDEKN